MSRFFVLVGEDDGTGFDNVPSRVVPAPDTSPWVHPDVSPGIDANRDDYALLRRWVADDVSRPDAYWGTGCGGDPLDFYRMSALDLLEQERIAGWPAGAIVCGIGARYWDGSLEPAGWYLVDNDAWTDPSHVVLFDPERP